MVHTSKFVHWIVKTVNKIRISYCMYMNKRLSNNYLSVTLKLIKIFSWRILRAILHGSIWPYLTEGHIPCPKLINCRLILLRVYKNYNNNYEYRKTLNILVEYLNNKFWFYKPHKLSFKSCGSDFSHLHSHLQVTKINQFIYSLIYSACIWHVF